MTAVQEATKAPPAGGSSYQRQMAAYRQRIAAQQAEAAAAAAAASSQAAADVSKADGSASAAQEPVPAAEATLAELPACSPCSSRGEDQHTALAPGDNSCLGEQGAQGGPVVLQAARPAAAAAAPQLTVSPASSLPSAAAPAGIQLLPPPAVPEDSPHLRSIRLAAERIAACAAAVAEADRQSAAGLAGLGLAAAGTGLMVGPDGGGASPGGGALRTREAAVAAALQRCVQQC